MVIMKKRFCLSLAALALMLAGGCASTEKLTIEEAKTAVLADLGLDEEAVTFYKCEQDIENGREFYEIECYTLDNKEYEYEIDAYTGEVIGYTVDFDRTASDGFSGSTESLKDTLQDDPAASVGVIGEEEAKRLALERVPGASASDIYEFKVDYDYGDMEYEGEIIYDGVEYEFEIDAYTGGFRSWEEERH